MTTQITTGKGKINNAEELNKKIILITNSQRPYIQKILNYLNEILKMLKHFAIIFYLNKLDLIKESTKEGKIKVLVWLSEFLEDKPFKDMKRKILFLFLQN